MQYGVVFPHNEIGTDPGAIKAYAQGVEALGATHLLIYDHVLGADPNRPGGFQGPYDKDAAFHEPLTTFAFIAAVTETVEMATTVLILPQRQTVLVAKQAAEVAILSGQPLPPRGGHRLERGGVRWASDEPFTRNRGPAPGGAGGAPSAGSGPKTAWTTPASTTASTGRGIKPRPSQPVPIWFGGAAPVVLDRCRAAGRRVDALGRTRRGQRKVYSGLTRAMRRRWTRVRRVRYSGPGDVRRR